MAILKRNKKNASKPAPKPEPTPPPPKPAVPRAAAPKPEPPKPAVPRANVPRPTKPVAETPLKPEPQRPIIPRATVMDPSNPVVPLVENVKPRGKIKPKDRADYTEPEHYFKLFDGRGDSEDNPVPKAILDAHFPPVHGDGRDIPTGVWVQNKYGIIYKFVQVSNTSRVDIIRSLLKPSLEMNFREDEL